jgi:hypothetical protein
VFVVSTVKTRDEVLITNSKFGGTCIVVEKKINTFQVVKVFVVIAREGNFNLQPRKLSVCSIKEQFIFFFKK